MANKDIKTQSGEHSETVSIQQESLKEALNNLYAKELTLRTKPS